MLGGLVEESVDAGLLDMPEPDVVPAAAPVEPEFIDDVPLVDELELLSVDVPVLEEVDGLGLVVVPAAAPVLSELVPEVEPLMLEPLLVPEVVPLVVSVLVPLMGELAPVAAAFAPGVDVPGAVALDGAPPLLPEVSPPVPVWA